MESHPRSRADIKAFRKANVSAIRGDVTDYEVAESDEFESASTKTQPRPAHSDEAFHAALVYTQSRPGGGADSGVAIDGADRLLI